MTKQLKKIFIKTIFPLILILIIIILSKKLSHYFSEVPPLDFTIFLFLIFFSNIFFQIEFNKQINLYNYVLILFISFMLLIFFEKYFLLIIIPFFIILFEKKKMFLKLLISYIALFFINDYINSTPQEVLINISLSSDNFIKSLLIYITGYLYYISIIIYINIFNLNLKKNKDTKKWKRNLLITNIIYLVLITFFVVLYGMNKSYWHPFLERFFLCGSKYLNVIVLMFLFILHGLIANGISYLFRKKLYPSTVFFVYFVLWCSLSIHWFIHLVKLSLGKG